jgi:hypothetical protein
LIKGAASQVIRQLRNQVSQKWTTELLAEAQQFRRHERRLLLNTEVTGVVRQTRVSARRARADA